LNIIGHNSGYTQGTLHF